MVALYPIRPGMTARLIDGGTVTVVDVLDATASRRCRLLVLRTDSLTGRKVVAPYSAVSYVSGPVHLSLSMRQVLALPAFDPIRHRRF